MLCSFSTMMPQEPHSAKAMEALRLHKKIVQDIMCEECRLELKSWYARVPSHSNVSDGPSRLDCEEVRQLGSSGREVDWDSILENFLRWSWCFFNMGRARAHRKIPQLLGKKSECVPNDFVSEAVMHLFYFISPVVLFTTVILFARELLTLRFPKRISWDSSWKEDTDLILKKEKFWFDQN